MASIDKNSFFNYYEHNAQSGYKAAWLVKEQGASKYSLLVASETVPSVFGSEDSFEFDLLQSPVKGKVKGKMTLDDKEVEVLHTRDNVLRANRLKDKVLDFLFIDSQFVGYKYSGTLSYRVNDAEADILRGTFTIVPMSADPDPIMDCRSLIMETLCFESVIPDTVKAGDTIEADVVQDIASVSYEFVKIDAYGKETPDSTDITASGSKLTIGSSASGLYGITAKADGYASWTTTIYVEPAVDSYRARTSTQVRM